MARFLTAVLVGLVAVLSVGRAAAQDVLITEFIASNSAGLQDEDGDYPDWLELYNPGSTAVDLDGWYLTDKATNLTKWRVPAVTIAPRGFLVVLCSSKNRTDPAKPLHTNFKLGASGSYLALIKPDGVTVSSAYDPAYPAQQTDVAYGMAFEGGPVSFLGPGAAAKAHVPSSDALAGTWIQPDFDDAGWKAGSTGVGFERASGYESLIGLDVGQEMYNVNATAYIRLPFTLDSVPDLTALTLRMKYDDGFWAFLNGVPVASANTPAVRAWNASAPAFYDDAQAVQWHEFDVSAARSALRSGTNVLAIHALNNGKTSSDFLMVPELAGVGDAVVHPDERGYLATPTPGAPNSAALVQGPFVGDVEHAPAVPNPGESLTVTAEVTAAVAAVGDVTLTYRVDFGAETTIPMTEVKAGEYSAMIPASAYGPGQMVRYYVSATDVEDRASRFPTFSSPTGSPEYQGTMVADPAVQTALPVLYWWIQNPSAADVEAGTRASIYYNGRFYDNVFCKLRGNTSTSWPKKNYKFEMNSGYDMIWDEDAPPVDEFNLQSTHSDKTYMRQVLAWESYEQAGVPGVHAFHVRVQQNGMFYSVAEWVEHPDKSFLNRIGLDEDGALYKMYNEFTSAALGEDWVEKKTPKDDDSSDLQAFINGAQLTGPALTRYLFDNVDIPEAINYLAVTTVMHDNDHVGKNYFVYRDTQGNKEWKILPWDKDLTFGRNFTQGQVLNDVIWAANDPYSHPLFGDRSHPKVDGPWNRLIDALYREPTIRQMYLRRLRTVMEDLLQPPGTPLAERKYEKRIDELVALIGPDVQLDRARWGNPYGQNQDLSIAVFAMKNSYLSPRRVHLFNNHSTSGDKLIPDTQAAAPALAFGAIHRVPAGGNTDEEYLEIVNPTAEAVDVSGWTLRGAVSITFEPGTVVPAGGTMYVSPNVNAFRARAAAPTGGMGLFVRGDYTGRLSDGDGPVTLATSAGAVIATTPFTPADLRKALSLAAGFETATPDDMARLNVVTDGGSESAVDVQDAASLAQRVSGP